MTAKTTRRRLFVWLFCVCWVARLGLAADPATPPLFPYFDAANEPRYLEPFWAQPSPNAGPQLPFGTPAPAAGAPGAWAGSVPPQPVFPLRSQFDSNHVYASLWAEPDGFVEPIFVETLQDSAAPRLVSKRSHRSRHSRRHARPHTSAQPEWGHSEELLQPMRFLPAAAFAAMPPMPPPAFVPVFAVPAMMPGAFEPAAAAGARFRFRGAQPALNTYPQGWPSTPSVYSLEDVYDQYGGPFDNYGPAYYAPPRRRQPAEFSPFAGNAPAFAAGAAGAAGSAASAPASSSAASLSGAAPSSAPFDVSQLAAAQPTIPDPFAYPAVQAASTVPRAGGDFLFPLPVSAYRYPPRALSPWYSYSNAYPAPAYRATLPPLDYNFGFGAGVPPFASPQEFRRQQKQIYQDPWQLQRLIPRQSLDSLAASSTGRLPVPPYTQGGISRATRDASMDRMWAYLHPEYFIWPYQKYW